MKRIITTGAILLASLISFNAVAQMSAEDAKQAYERRHGLYLLLSHSNTPLGLMARGQMEFNQEVAVRAVERVAMLATLIPEVFEPDTRGANLPETRAFDAIWDNKEEFVQLAADLRTGALAAIDILNSQGADGVRQAVQQVGPKCGACHDRFRAEEE